MFDGPRGPQLRRLYDGDASDYRKPDGSPDWSSADGSLCAGAWYYSDGDAATAWSILLGSGLARCPPQPREARPSRLPAEHVQLVAGSKTFRDTHGYSAWEDPPRIQFKPKPPAVIGNDGASTCPDDEPATLEDALALHRPASAGERRARVDGPRSRRLGRSNGRLRRGASGLQRHAEPEADRCSGTDRAAQPREVRHLPTLEAEDVDVQP